MDDSTHDAHLGQRFATAIGNGRFELWFPHHAQLHADRGVLTVATESTFLRDLVRTNVGDELEVTARSLLGDGTKLRYVVVERSDDTSCDPRPQRRQPQQRKPCEAEKRPATCSATSGQTFSNFVVGQSNRFAFEVARQIAVRGTAGTPVLLVGPCGSGKSHLLSSIRTEFRRRFSRDRALLLTAEQFTTGFLGALNGGGLPNFRQKHRDVDLLIVDNLPFFLGKRATIEELQYTIDRVLAEGGQVVVTSSRPLNELADLGSDLLSRFSSGLVCDLTLPDAAARREIISQLFVGQNTPVSEEVVGILATGLATGVRELMGVVNRLAAQNRLLGDAIDRPLAERVVGQANRHTCRPVKIGDIERVVCDFFGVEGKRLRGNDRHKTVSQPRMVAMWLARKYTQSAWREIGDYFGGRSHSTVISAHRRIEKQLTGAGEFRIAGQPWQLQDAIERLEAALRAG